MEVKRSWETSASGIGAILVAIGSALKAQFDGDPSTIPDWGLVISLGVAGFGLLRARDNNKNSEEIGADPITKSIAAAEKKEVTNGIISLWVWLVMAVCVSLVVSGITGCTSTEARTRYNVVQTEVTAASAGISGWNIYKAQKNAELVTKKAAWNKMPEGPPKDALKDTIEETRRTLKRKNIEIQAALQVYTESLLLELNGVGSGVTNNAAELTAARAQVLDAEKNLADTISRAQK
jgi:hypothetical protein